MDRGGRRLKAKSQVFCDVRLTLKSTIQKYLKSVCICIKQGGTADKKIFVLGRDFSAKDFLFGETYVYIKQTMAKLNLI